MTTDKNSALYGFKIEDIKGDSKNKLPFAFWNDERRVKLYVVEENYEELDDMNERAAWLQNVYFGDDTSSHHRYTFLPGVMRDGVTLDDYNTGRVTSEVFSPLMVRWYMVCSLRSREPGKVIPSMFPIINPVLSARVMKFYLDARRFPRETDMSFGEDVVKGIITPFNAVMDMTGIEAGTARKRHVGPRVNF